MNLCSGVAPTEDGRKVFRWLVVGAGREEYEERLRLQIESLGMSGDVFMAGAVFPALPIYRVASVLSCLLKNEAFGMVWLKRQPPVFPLLPVRLAGSRMPFRKM